VGGSLVAQGGHNILEPAVHGKPIVYGPHMQNFAEISETFLQNQAAVQVSGDAELVSVVARLVGDPVERARLGAAARALVEANRGAKARTLDVIAALLPPPGSRGVVRPFRRG
jgi:3-deoxy-D-manno-octulosonic-acid transferase